MDLTKIPELSITFGTLQLLQPGDVIDASDGVLDFDTQYSVEAIRAVGAAAPTLDEYGNTVRDGSISIAVEYESIQAALADILARQAAVDEAGKLATLTYSATHGTSTATRSYTAGLQRLTQSTSRSANGVRVVHTYSWIIAGVVVSARATVTPLDEYSAPAYSIAVKKTGGEVVGSFSYGGGGDTANFVAALNDLDNWGVGPGQPMETPLVHAKLDGGMVVLEVVGTAWIGTAGNGLYLDDGAPGTELPFTDETPVGFSGGAG